VSGKNLERSNMRNK